jgi:hypothetical protein
VRDSATVLVNQEIAARKRQVFTLDQDMSILQAVKRFRRQNGFEKRIQWSEVLLQDLKLQQFTLDQVKGHFKHLMKTFNNDIDQASSEVNKKINMEKTPK